MFAPRIFCLLYFLMVITSLNMPLLYIKLLGSPVHLAYDTCNCYSTKQIGPIGLITPTTMMGRRVMFLH
jgi:hypothetical protein